MSQDTLQQSHAAENAVKVIAAVAVDLDLSPIGTRSRLADDFRGHPVLWHTVERLLKVEGVEKIVLMVQERGESGEEINIKKTHQLLGELADRVVYMELIDRPAALTARIREARAWNLYGWRGGAGQWMVFDEDFYTQSLMAAMKSLSAAHVLCVPAHAALVDVELLSRLVQHHLYKNHELGLTYTPSAPGLGGMLIRVETLEKMVGDSKDRHTVPGEILGYNPQVPTGDTLIRDACMQVDPALSKIQNRFLLDTQRVWETIDNSECGMRNAECEIEYEGLAALAIRTAQESQKRCGIARRQPKELELELTPRRWSEPMGAVPKKVREARGELNAAAWVKWLESQHFCDDLLLTLCGDGDPLLYEGIAEVAAAARKAGAQHIHLQSDCAGNADTLCKLARERLIDVVSISFYGHTAPTYAKVSGVADSKRFDHVLENLGKLADVIRAEAAGLPLVLARLLKVRDTIPEMEPFFDTWVMRCGWAVIDAPTDRAGEIPFEAVVDMAPPKRRACRRMQQRMLIRSNGIGVMCDQDIFDKLAAGTIQTHSLEEMWCSEKTMELLAAHAAGEFEKIKPCDRCREWHRA